MTNEIAIQERPEVLGGNFLEQSIHLCGKKGRKKGPINSVGLSRLALLEFRAELTDIVRIEIRVVGERKEC